AEPDSEHTGQSCYPRGREGPSRLGPRGPARGGRAPFPSPSEEKQLQQQAPARAVPRVPPPLPGEDGGDQRRGARQPAHYSPGVPVHFPVPRPGAGSGE
ncbi:unnamed protein product, partial [Ectocarpus fasciculatus]